MQKEATLEELRESIDQIHGCDAGPACEVVDVPIYTSNSLMIRVHVFEVQGHAHARRCSTWAEYPDVTTMVIHAVLHIGKITSAADAVRTHIGKIVERRIANGSGRSRSRRAPASRGES